MLILLFTFIGEIVIVDRAHFDAIGRRIVQRIHSMAWHHGSASAKRSAAWKLMRQMENVSEQKQCGEQ